MSTNARPSSEALAALVLDELPEAEARAIRDAADGDAELRDTLDALEAARTRLEAYAHEAAPGSWVEQCIQLHDHHAPRAAAWRRILEHIIAHPPPVPEARQEALAAQISVEDPITASTTPLGDLVSSLAHPVLVLAERGVFLYRRENELIGTLQDQQGRPVGGVAVSLDSEGRRWEGVSSPGGLVLLLAVPPGTYALRLGSPINLLETVEIGDNV